jgi:hypothetical protein
MKQAELMAALSRKDRDIQSIMAQKRDALSALENVPAGERSLGGGAATLAVLERLKDLQDKVEPSPLSEATCFTRHLLYCLSFFPALKQTRLFFSLAAGQGRRCGSDNDSPAEPPSTGCSARTPGHASRGSEASSTR